MAYSEFRNYSRTFASATFAVDPSAAPNSLPSGRKGDLLAPLLQGVIMAAFRRRFGFTLIDLLVVIAVLVLLAGLLFPAILRTRERASRIACSNKMRQLGIAM